MRRVVILDSTGSIGTQALDVIARNRHSFEVVGLAAGGADPALLAAQAHEFGVHSVAIAREDMVDAFRAAFVAQAAGQTVPTVLAGPDAAAELAATPCDVVLNGITGSIGLAPTLATLRSGAVLALANKESLIVGGPLVKAMASPDQIVPVDSEHSAIAQCLRGGRRDEVERLVLTASGGPFRGRSLEDLGAVTPEQALAHPTWSMGPVVTTNSATMVNKGLEVIEAHLLFDIPMDRIDVVVHPQSIVHSMVAFSDGSTMAQVSPPDMRLPIALGLAWPERVPDAAPANDWSTPTSWDFEPLDDTVFPAVALARRVGTRGGTASAVFNAANEECVASFLGGGLAFLDIVSTIEQVVDAHEVIDAPTLEAVLAAETWARHEARTIAGAVRA